MENKKIPEDVRSSLYDADINGRGRHFWDSIFIKAEKILNKSKYSPLCEKVWEKQCKIVIRTYTGGEICYDISKDDLNKALEGIVEVPDYCDEILGDFLNDYHNDYITIGESVENLVNRLKAGKYSKNT